MRVVVRGWRAAGRGLDAAASVVHRGCGVALPTALVAGALGWGMLAWGEIPAGGAPRVGAESDAAPEASPASLAGALALVLRPTLTDNPEAGVEAVAADEGAPAEQAAEEAAPQRVVRVVLASPWTGAARELAEAARRERETAAR